MDLSILKSVSDLGLALVGLGVVSVVLYRFIERYITDLKQQRDDAKALAAAGAAAIDRLTEKQDARFDRVEERLGNIEREVRR